MPLEIDPEAIARDTLDFIRVPSETGTEGAGSRFFAALLERQGCEVSLDEVAPGRPNVMGRLPGTGCGPSLMLNGHTDTIPIGASAPPARDGDWIVGRGAEDMKGGLVAMAHAAGALRRAGLRLGGDLWLTGVVGHETPAGKKEGPLRLISRLRGGYARPAAILIAEGPAAIWCASLGSTIFHLTIESPRGPIHTIKTSYSENPARWTGWLLEELARLEERFALSPPHPLCGREQINVGIVHAGDYPNRLPTPARLTGTWRWMPGDTVEHVRAELGRLCAGIRQRSGLNAAYAIEGAREPFETPPDHAIVRAIEAAAAAISGEPPPRIGMALVGDANLFANLAGVPAVYYGPAHETAHSDFERVSLARLAHCAQVYARAAIEFCGAA